MKFTQGLITSWSEVVKEEPRDSLTMIVNKAKIAAFQEVIDDIQSPPVEISHDYVAILTEVLEDKINELKRRDERYY
tara:strand:+ start:275 stop:505 length:231 start_codon:yes stop_codon:yes gene_type:complete